ncbi:MAG: proton-conducting transporter membrane subunit [Balneolaceae bacterium]|nr:proton-conducting transporter membrane subunit [Balneolaceae bacterium]
MSIRSANQSLRNKNRIFSRILVQGMWTTFLFFLVLLGIAFYRPIEWRFEGFLLVDHLTLVIAAAATLFGSIVLSYSARYLAGSAKLPRFLLNCTLFILSVLLVVISDHIALFTFGWLIMGLLMAELIGGYTHYLEGKASRRNARNYFLLSTLLLAGGLTWLAAETGIWHISGIVSADLPAGSTVVRLSMLLVIVATVIQAALYPFQRWLMSSMTAPTPASALMHAGFVNAGAILLARTAPLIYLADLLWILVLAGGIGALVGKFSKFVQANIKQKLACSTTAQMGFMLLQCGLGFFSAAVAHLILHGFYKAFLFLSSGDNVARESPTSGDEDRWKNWYLPITLVSGLAGGILFAYATGKGLALNSGFFLTFVIVLTVIHGSQDILRHSSLPAVTRLIALPLVIIPALLVYAGMFNGVSQLLTTVPMAEVPVAIAWDQITVAVLYLATFLVIELKLYRKSRRLYVYLLNISQPKSNTILQ